MALVVNILTLDITEHELYQIVVGVLNFDPWPQQQALTQRSMLYIYGKQLRKCWDGQLLNHTFCGQVTRSQFTSTLVRLMDFKQGLDLTKNTPIVLKATLCIKLQVIMSSFISRLSSGQKSVASYCKMGRQLYNV